MTRPIDPLAQHRTIATEAQQQLIVELVLKRQMTIKAAGEQVGISAYIAGQIVRRARGIAQGSASSPFPRPTQRRLNGNSWQLEAACRDHDPELWFPTGRGTGRRNADGSANASSDAYELQVLEAQTVCRGCPVLEQCPPRPRPRTVGRMGGVAAARGTLRQGGRPDLRAARCARGARREGERIVTMADEQQRLEAAAVAYAEAKGLHDLSECPNQDLGDEWDRRIGELELRLRAAVEQAHVDAVHDRFGASTCGRCRPLLDEIASALAGVE